MKQKLTDLGEFKLFILIFIIAFPIISTYGPIVGKKLVDEWLEKEKENEK